MVIAVAALVVAAAVPTSASADRSDCPRHLERSYSKHHRQVAKLHGKRAPGRNIRKHGVLFKHNVFNATCGEIRRSNHQLAKLLRRPSYPTLVRTAVAPAQPPAGVRSAGVDGAFNGWAIPESIVMCESGGNYNARNPSSGAYGAYQILPSTAAAYGCDMSTPGGQDICAAKVWVGQGRGAWVC